MQDEKTHTSCDETIAVSPTADNAAELETQHVRLSWRSWTVVFVSCWAIVAQVFVVTAAGSVIAFIIRDLGDAPIAGWVIREFLPPPLDSEK